MSLQQVAAFLAACRCTAIAAIIGILHGHAWEDLQKAFLNSAASGLEAVILLALMGGLVAPWLLIPPVLVVLMVVFRIPPFQV